METATQLYVQIQDNQGRTTNNRIAVKDEKHVVERAVSLGGAFFHTYEVDAIHLNGKIYTGPEENWSSRHYLVDKKTLFTREQVVEEVKNNPSNYTAQQLEGVVEDVKMYPSDTMFINHHRGYDIVEQGSKVFDRDTKKQLWPLLRKGTTAELVAAFTKAATYDTILAVAFPDINVLKAEKIVAQLLDAGAIEESNVSGIAVFHAPEVSCTQVRFTQAEGFRDITYAPEKGLHITRNKINAEKLAP